MAKTAGKMMKTAVMTDLRKVEIQQREVPQPAPGEVLVKTEYVGICGSDLHYYESGRIGDFIVKTPFVLGHEAAGTVVEVGTGVTQLKVGDRVALEPGKTCGVCEMCKSGKYNLCEKVQFFATPPVDGVFQEYVAHEAGLCFKLPDAVSSMEGALIEPLAVGIHAANQGGAHLGQTAVVTGAGCIGLVSLLALKAMGVSKVIVADIVEKRLQKALELGADAVINGSREDTVARILELTGGNGQDLGIETAGTDITAGQLIRASKRGGTIVQVGYSASGNMTLPMGAALDKEITIKTVFRYRNIYPMAIEAVASGRIAIKNIVTNEFELDDIQNALDACVNNKADIVKGVIRIQ
ncbi:MAG: NAD(P)-dependent alcohol dehydrogenase [Clostridiales bacterium]|nr:NAD(P)-dependent alcohol dehydrogenase [Clostridiales bacterium]